MTPEEKRDRVDQLIDIGLADEAKTVETQLEEVKVKSGIALEVNVPGMEEKE